MKKNLIVTALFVLSCAVISDFGHFSPKNNKVVAESTSNVFEENPVNESEIEECIMNFENSEYKASNSKDSKNNDTDYLKNNLKDSFEYDGETYSALVNEEDGMIDIGFCEDVTKTITWQLFNSKNYKLYDALVLYSSPVHKDVEKITAGSIAVSNRLSNFSLGVEKGVSVGSSLNLNLKVGGGFGGFCQAGMSASISKEIETDSTISINLEYDINNNLKDGESFLSYEYAKYTKRFFVFRFSHTFENTGWTNLTSNPIVHLYLLPKVSVVDITVYSSLKIERI